MISARRLSPIAMLFTDMLKSMTKKQKRLLKRISLAILLALPCFFIPEKIIIVRAIAFLIPYSVAGYDIIFKSFRNIKNGQVFDENLLMGIATIGAYSLGEFSEAVMVVLLYQAGELFQSYAVTRSRRSISELMDIRPDYANLVKGDGYYDTVSPDDINIGDIILIKSGEKIPLDCVITEGASEIDTASLTGESLPQYVAPGDSLISGSVNISGTLKARVTKVYGESTVSKIIELTEKSAERKSKSENFITKFARYYTPVVCTLALCMAVIPTLIFGNFTENLKSALIFLVVSCPCALVISVPLSFFCGIGCASKNGILIKGASFIEALSSAETMIFDKTGTLTTGEFIITNLICEEGIDKNTLLYYAAKAEYYSEHPTAIAIKNAVSDVSSEDISSSRQIVGKGVYASVKDKDVYVGNIGLMKELQIICPEEKNNQTILYVAIDNKYYGKIYISDTVKSDASDTISKLKRYGIKRTVMLTGDKKDVAESIGKTIGIDKIYSELLPEDKVSLAENEMNVSKGKTTVYIGDGINDAPVLSRVDIGIAMGGLGSDAAIEAADIVIMDDKLSKIPISVAIARKTMRIVRQNIVFSIGIKVAVMLISALGISTSMWLAIFADVGVAVLAILNALRTFNIKP